MLITDVIIDKIIKLENNIYLLKLFAPDIAKIIQPGQFLNVKVNESTFPLLRRPFSICDVEDDFIYIMFDVHGEGTRQLTQKLVGDKINLIGPLGNGFNIQGDYQTAVIVAGGIGAAPFPYLIRSLSEQKIKTVSFIGARDKDSLINYGFKDKYIATDDGSFGTKGTVVDLFAEKEYLFANQKVKIFGCGPTPMLKALGCLCINKAYDCEISTECVMACGFGICQGCPIESSKDNSRYLLICKDGPVFNVKDIQLK